MIHLKYKIKPTIHFENKELWIFNNEILSMDLSQIQDGIDSCELVMEGKYAEINWGLEVSDFAIHKKTSTLTYHRKFVAEIPTMELYNMLKKYKEALEKFGNVSDVALKL